MNTAAKSISKYDDLIYSREVIARIEYLESGVEECDRCADRLICEEDEHNEYLDLKALADEAEGYSGDWKWGATLIRDSYFKNYAQELAEDIGAIKSDAEWPLRHIDWDAAADELKSDYTSVTFDDIDYWIR